MHSAVYSFSMISVMLLICNVGFASRLQWLRLTEDNFTSDIRNHPFVVCISTVSWCGESISIMKELVKSIEADQKLHSVVELRVIYANLDKDLGLAALGRKKTPALTFYLHATPYKYKGRLKVQNILAAMHRGSFISSGDFPFRRLESKLDVENFLEFTEKAVILYDICNYAEKLGGRKWQRMINKGSDTLQDDVGELPSAFHKDPGIHHGNANVDAGTLQSDEIHVRQSVSSSMKDVSQESLLNDSVTSNFSSADDNEIVTSRISTRSSILESKYTFMDGERPRLFTVDVDKEQNSETCSSFTENLLQTNKEILGQSTGCPFEITDSYDSPVSVSDYHQSASSLTNFNHGNMCIHNSFDNSHGCNSTDYRHFAILYQNLTKLARSHVLTPERMDFAIIRDRRLFLDLGISKMQNNTWLLIVQTMDQPDSPKIYIENQTVDTFIFHSGRLMPELNRDRAQYQSLMEEKPTVILFIDRVSPLHEVRVKSWDALRAFQTVFGEIQRMRDSKGNVYRPDVKELQEKKVAIKTVARNELFSSIANVKASLDNSALTQTILEHQPESNEGKILHQEVGNHDNTVVVRVLFGEQKMQLQGSLLETSSDNFQSLDLRSILFSENIAVYESQHGEVDKNIVYPSPMDEMQPISLQQLSTEQTMQTSSEIDISEAVPEKLHNLNFMPSLSYFFLDGDDSMKEILLPGFSYPCLVILDPSKSGQFIFPVNDQSLSYATIRTFIDQFSRGLLKSVYQSGVVPQGSRQQVKPPFVNRDFHVMNGVPQITTAELSEILSDSGMPDCALDLMKEEICQAKERDILVHFTLAACGFCKRMELIFSEMHKLLTLHLDACLKSKSIWQNSDGKQATCVTDAWNNFQDKASCGNGDCYTLKGKLPLLFQIDCTVNECKLFFEGIDQEKYPSTIFFSKSRENKTFYGGGPTMQGLLEFIAYQSDIEMHVLQMLQGSSLPYQCYH